MNVISWVMAIFAVSGAVDLIFGNRLGLGKEFEKGFEMMHSGKSGKVILDWRNIK